MGKPKRRRDNVSEPSSKKRRKFVKSNQPKAGQKPVSNVANKASKRQKRANASSTAPRKSKKNKKHSKNMSIITKKKAPPVHQSYAKRTETSQDRVAQPGLKQKRAAQQRQRAKAMESKKRKEVHNWLQAKYGGGPVSEEEVATELQFRKNMSSVNKIAAFLKHMVPNKRRMNDRRNPSRLSSRVTNPKKVSTVSVSGLNLLSLSMICGM